MLRIAIKPEEQSRFTVEMGTPCGIPAAIAAAREMYRGDGGWQVPRMDYSDKRRENGINILTYANVIDLGRVQTSRFEGCLYIELSLRSDRADDPVSP